MTLAVEGRVALRRCRDPQTVETILRRDYFDDPVRHFPDGAIRSLARGWFARSRDIYLYCAEVDGCYAGFVFGHTLGPSIWKRFAVAHPWHLPTLAQVWLRTRRPRRRRPVIRPTVEGRPDVPRLDRPFAWSRSQPGAPVGIVELLFVSEAHRGHGLAPLLLQAVADAMDADGVRRMEAHVDAPNVASVRAFLKAGWAVYEMTGRDYLASCEVGTQS